MKDNNCGDDAITFIPYYGHLWDIVIPDNRDIISNNIIERTFLSPYFWYKIQDIIRKTDIATNVIIHKMTESINFNTIL